jgi:hypothetical protein
MKLIFNVLYCFIYIFLTSSLLHCNLGLVKRGKTSITNYKQLSTALLHWFSLQKLFKCMKQIIHCEANFTSFLKRLKLSNVLIFKGRYLYNLTPMFKTLFETKYITKFCMQVVFTSRIVFMDHKVLLQICLVLLYKTQKF